MPFFAQFEFLPMLCPFLCANAVFLAMLLFIHVCMRAKSAGEIGSKKTARSPCLLQISNKPIVWCARFTNLFIQPGLCARALPHKRCICFGKSLTSGDLSAHAHGAGTG